jgi:hypothetical protein
MAESKLYFKFARTTCNVAVNVNSVQPLVRGRCQILSKIFFHHRFSGEPTQIMRRKFVEYLGTDCLHFCRIPVEFSCQCVEYKTYEALHKMHG